MQKLVTIQPDSIFGLTVDEVSESRTKYGDNQLGRRKTKTFLKQFIENFDDPIIKILLIVLAVNLILLFKNFEWYESAGIAVAIFWRHLYRLYLNMAVNQHLKGCRRRRIERHAE